MKKKFLFISASLLPTLIFLLIKYKHIQSVPILFENHTAFNTNKLIVSIMVVFLFGLLSAYQVEFNSFVSSKNYESK